MGSFDHEITNPTKKRVEKIIGKSVEGNHLKETSMTTLTFLKWGRVTCPFMWTLKCGGLFSRGPSLDHHGATPMTTWVTSLSVGLGLTFDLINSRAA
jgi:hypothetical protein